MSTGRHNHDTSPNTEAKHVRPAQAWESLRKAINERMLDCDADANTRKTLQARQWGTGVSGGADAVARTHLRIGDMYGRGQLSQPIAIMQKDEDNCFGRKESARLREGVAQGYPALAPWASWKHLNGTHVHQPGVAPYATHRGAQQGDAQGGLEASASIIKADSTHESHSTRKAGMQGGPDRAKHSMQPSTTSGNDAQQSRGSGAASPPRLDARC